MCCAVLYSVAFHLFLFHVLDAVFPKQPALKTAMSMIKDFKSGWISRDDKMIPLDRIQDLNITQDCCSRLCGVFSLQIQTAGNSNPKAGAEAHLYAVKEPIAVRNEIMTRRDRLVIGVEWVCRTKKRNYQ
jgi:membrane protein YdbS with pleckstrin-like domain